MRPIILALASAFAVLLPAWAQNPSTPDSQKNSMPCMAGMAMPGCTQIDVPPAPRGPGPDPHPTMAIQEPETPNQHTGENLPAPELLKDVAAHQTMTLADFETLADANNPTLKEAEALVRRSHEQAHQAGIYPNPSVGYQGEQIRGGSYGGGEQGGFIQQTIVLGGKLGLRRNIYVQQQRVDESGLSEQTRRVHADVQQAFYAALSATEEVRLRQRLLAISQDGYSIAVGEHFRESMRDV